MKKLKYDFTKNDKGKTIVNLKHDFYPFDEDKDIVVHCRYIPAGKFMSYADMRNGGYDMQKLFIEQVDSIDGIEIEGYKEVITPEFFASLNGDIPNAVVTRTVAHLLANEELTDAEIKN